MVHFSLLSATAGILAATSLVSSTPLPSNPDDQPRAVIVPFVNKHAEARRSTNSAELIKRDLHRIQQRNERASSVERSGVEAVKVKRTAAALEPYDINILRKAHMKKRQGSAHNALVNDNDKLYYGNMNIGTPAQVITINFDTGSSDLTVPTAACTNCTAPFFDPSQSTSFVMTNQPFNTSFEDHSYANGVICTETVGIGSLSVSNQSFAAINEASDNYDGPNAGLIGLAFEANANTNAAPWFINLANQGALESNVFSFYLTPQGAEASELCVGCIDTTKFTGEPEYFPLTPGNASQSYWDITAQGFTYNGNLVTQTMTATIDSGATSITIPPSQASAVYANIPGAQAQADGDWTFPCANAGSIGIMFSSSTVFTISPTQFGTDDGSGLCTGAIASSSAEDGAATVGDAFLRTWYSVFDYGNMRVGFAQAV